MSSIPINRQLFPSVSTNTKPDLSPASQSEKSKKRALSQIKNSPEITFKLVDQEIPMEPADIRRSSSSSTISILSSGSRRDSTVSLNDTTVSLWTSSPTSPNNNDASRKRLKRNAFLLNPAAVSTDLSKAVTKSIDRSKSSKRKLTRGRHSLPTDLSWLRRNMDDIFPPIDCNSQTSHPVRSFRTTAPSGPLNETNFLKRRAPVRADLPSSPPAETIVGNALKATRDVVAKQQPLLDQSIQGTSHSLRQPDFQYNTQPRPCSRRATQSSSTSRLRAKFRASLELFLRQEMASQYSRLQVVSTEMSSCLDRAQQSCSPCTVEDLKMAQADFVAGTGKMNDIINTSLEAFTDKMVQMNSVLESGAGCGEKWVRLMTLALR
ncbi:uncharacterized protein V1516DRAFT_681433, partial [Lipomyces oligophaga]|uniref:uncharacterized protein n=1 Tax=Lipomyces oligophaga TaxID=45792 RepID=UPI0034CF6C0C